MKPGRRPTGPARGSAAVAGIIAAATAAEEGLGGKGPVPGHRKGPADPEKETPARRGIRGAEEAALLRKALSEKKDEEAGSGEAKAEAPQALTSGRFRAEAGKRRLGTPAASNYQTRKTEAWTRGSTEPPSLDTVVLLKKKPHQHPDLVGRAIDYASRKNR